MKKIIITYLCLLLVCVSLCSCISNTDKTKDDSNKFDESITDTNILYSSERLVTENQTIFASLIEDNPIDKAYHSAEHDDTTQGMVDIEIKFADRVKAISLLLEQATNGEDGMAALVAALEESR